ncbi:plasmid pRiA4b ORF-3 family protein [Alkalinema sp. FACHB-956]|uniref:plasmid pRiA4b ORF-3 family protein n=1 Tax=Alkalinema sp. FACHB-956 TaxID=2692768 RepID=UPI001685EF98|nr:plasmid pRiA4b ORF-3 family protein [Alkalinema sp. FACHB-956]MBD2327177.1 plasmid pRiA4b ORF-3 family protein [Alkalinema sp. FACHB-956]
MTFNLHQLDRLRPTDPAAETLLENYTIELIEQFRASPEGQDWIKLGMMPEDSVGSWVDNFLYFGFVYGQRPLTKMNTTSVKTLLTELFPQKVSLHHPDEADSTIPELIAFWQFLQRQYKLRQASAILNALKKIQPDFKSIINDSSKFGSAKAFVQAGFAAGVDLEDPEAVQAFQTEFNQTLQANHLAGQPPSIAPMLGQLLILMSDSDLEEEFENDLDDEDEIEEFPLDDWFNGGEDEDEAVANELAFERQIRQRNFEETISQFQPFSEASIVQLKAQVIDATHPGSILQDFQTLLDEIGQGIVVSAAQKQLPLKFLADLNDRLTTPLQLDLARPQQKSYPNIQGLYLLLKATGLAVIASQGSKSFLQINTKVLESWQTLNPTEKYCTLLEAWLVRSHEAMLDPQARSPLNEGAKVFCHWPHLSPNLPQTTRKTTKRQEPLAESILLKYYLGLHNLSLMALFGFVTLTSDKPAKGKGWNLKKVEQQPWGHSILQLYGQAMLNHDFIWQFEQDPYMPMGELQPTFQSYFPHWQQTLWVDKPEFSDGVYVFKVSLDKVWRKLAIDSRLPLYQLGRAILSAFDFDDTMHLDMFEYVTPYGMTERVHHPYAEGRPKTTKVAIGTLPLRVGQLMKYIFDFGDWWEFQILLEAIEPATDGENYIELRAQKGTAPQQYPDYDETW